MARGRRPSQRTLNSIRKKRASSREFKESTPTEPETLIQARVWDKKYLRYQIAGLCFPCAAQAAWGHTLGWGKGRIKDPCPKCQPIVNTFDTPGPRGSKWRKCLDKLERESGTPLEEVST